VRGASKRVHIRYLSTSLSAGWSKNDLKASRQD
jgi:hypothetical protein